MSANDPEADEKVYLYSFANEPDCCTRMKSSLPFHSVSGWPAAKLGSMRSPLTKLLPTSLWK